MNIVLLSGGSGQRLWPLSNDVRSKQFLKLFKNNNGEYESMLQKMYQQIKDIDADANIVVASSKAQISAVHNQLGTQVNVSAEPCRKGTFPAIVLACMYLADECNIDMDEPVVVCPVDPYVDEDYFGALNVLSDCAREDKANIVLMGTEPTYPSEKYGYIIPRSGERLSEVVSFKEKPTADVAKKYMENGALWNSGVFAFKLGYVLKKAHELIDFEDYIDLYEKYDTLPETSFDYATVEKEPKLQVLRFTGNWKDMGTWNTLTEAMEEKVIGKGVMNDTCENVHILNEMDIPVLAMGLRDVVISVSAEGILVSDKEQSSYIKPFVDSFEQQVMFAEKSWGSYKVMDVEKNAMTIKVTLNAGHSMNYHSHNNRNEVWVVLDGSGRTIVDGFEQRVHAGDVIAMSAGCKHTIIADSELKLVEVQLGEAISVEDKQKFELE